MFTFVWDLYVGLLVFTAIGAVYVYTSGYWGVVMADFQQGVIALLVIIIVSVYGVLAAGGPTAIISSLIDTIVPVSGEKHKAGEKKDKQRSTKKP